MKRVLLVFPTQWDLRQLESCRAEWQDEFEIVLGSPTEQELPDDFDAPAWVERCAAQYRGSIDGVFASCDYPGAAVAALLAERLGLPGSPPAAVLCAAHKYYARRVQRESVPEATPRFEWLDPQAAPPRALATGFPCFVKPVKGLFSRWARRVDDPDELARLLANPALREFLASWSATFERLLAPYPEFARGARALVAEELLGGELVTLEGLRQGSRLEILGVVDSGVDPATRSFTRFDLPSRLPASVQARMAELARRLVPALGLDCTLFNIEMFWEPRSDRIAIVEVNPRMVGQFADLYARTRGGSSYLDALRLATGAAPLERPAQPAGCAASVPLRTFEPVRVRRAPPPGNSRSSAPL
ncbi:MAG TPA: ATP-grasp domain-containing protein, partial [Myxococcota bacterium]|nr:ATP-grasp domain-containing protein [Myxococcota bacterium]